MSLLGIDTASERAGGDPGYRLDVGDVLARSFAAWAANIVPFTAVGVAVYSPVLLAYVLVAAAGGSTEAVRVLTLVENLLSLILIGAVTYGVFEHLSGEKPSLGDVLRNGLSKLGAVWSVGIVTGIGFILGFCALLVPGFILLARWWLAVPVAVIEGPGVFASLDRSVQLTENNRWRVFALALGSQIVVGVVALILGLVVGALLSGGGKDAAGEALMTLVLIPLQALSAVVPAIAYHDLRRGKEGADVAELLRAFD